MRLCQRWSPLQEPRLERHRARAGDDRSPQDRDAPMRPPNIACRRAGQARPPHAAIFGLGSGPGPLLACTCGSTAGPLPSKLHPKAPEKTISAFPHHLLQTTGATAVGGTPSAIPQPLSGDAVGRGGQRHDPGELDGGERGECSVCRRSEGVSAEAHGGGGGHQRPLTVVYSLSPVRKLRTDYCIESCSLSTI